MSRTPRSTAKKKRAASGSSARPRRSDAGGRARGPSGGKHAVVGIGRKAPDFELADDGGIPRKLSDFRGSPLILYFYPADDTPGCTKEACSFRDDYSAYVRERVTVLGVSPDSVKSHAKFKAKYRLPFLLLADPEHRICSLYGVWGRKSFLGRTYDGVLRTTFLIDGEGRVQRVFENVRPAEHSAEILAALRTA